MLRAFPFSALLLRTFVILLLLLNLSGCSDDSAPATTASTETAATANDSVGEGSAENGAAENDSVEKGIVENAAAENGIAESSSAEAAAESLSLEPAVVASDSLNDVADAQPDTTGIAAPTVIDTPASSAADAEILETPLSLNWTDLKQGRPVVRDDTANTVSIHARVSGAAGLKSTEIAQRIRVSDRAAVVSVLMPDVAGGTGDRALPELVISNIARPDSCGQALTVSWNSHAGVGSAGQQVFTVPGSAGDDNSPLELLSGGIIENGGGVLELVFNRNLNKDQALKHLISSQYRFTRYQVEGNKLRLGLNNSNAESLQLTIHKELQDHCGVGLTASQHKTFSIAPMKPAVRFTGQGMILPDATRIELPFQAVSAKSVTVTAFEVFADNVGQFLQENRLEGDQSLEKVGRFIWQKSIPLDEGGLRSWQDYRLDITELMNKKTGSLIRLTLSLDRGDSLLPCSDAENAVALPERKLPANADQLQHIDGDSSWNYYNQSSGGSNNLSACSDSYYEYTADVRAAKNLLRSNIGIVVKQAPDADIAHVIITNLKTSEPVANTEVEIFNFQGQSVGQGKTDKRGFVDVKLSGKAFYLQAAAGGQVGYLKLNEVSALTTSQFDIGGTHLQSNIDGFIYGERDIWRPGDNIYLTFILQDKLNELPDEHPVVVELFNPSGQLIESIYSNHPVGNLYTFTLTTPMNAPTGNWEAVVRVGGQDFHHPLRIETVVPNRLKVELDLAEDARLQNGVEQAVGLHSQWLHGAPASGLKADVSVMLVPVKTQFAGKFPEYTFDDPARDYRASKINLFEGTLDKQGDTAFGLLIDSKTPPPGMLKALFTNRVFEESGQFSSNSFSRPFDYYDRYLGLQLPKGDAARGMLLTDEDHKTRLVVLDKAGQPVSNTNLEISVYKLEWKWWYEKSTESLARYTDAQHSRVIASGEAVTDENGMAEWPLRVNYPEWGRYLVRACIAGEETHCSGKVVYIDWPGWAGRQQESQGDNVDRLTLFSDKGTYQVGETATVTLPELKEGRALVTVESATRVLQQFWVEQDAQKKRLKQQIEIAITPEMAPNIYLSVTYLQPHASRENDRPMRLMGIIPLQVEDPQKHLHPQISTVEQVNSRASFDIQVSESEGRPMAYTLALVDEGLLGLTNYSAPDPFKYFYQRQALQVKTWDLYKDVVGAYSGELHGLLPVGGSDAQSDDEKGKKNRRFPPLVQFIGSFKLAAGEKRSHPVTLPMYLGAVRVMLVAEDGSAYGKAEQEVVVRDDISVFPTLPRVMRTNEQAQVPVELFNNTAEPAPVQISLQVDDTRVQVAQTTQQLTLPPYSSAMASFAIQTGNITGKVEFTIELASADAQNSQTVYLDINAPNERTTRTTSYLVAGESSENLQLEPFGITGSNQASLALSLFKPVSLKSRMDYLVRYPHGCIEQTTSSVFPQLYLDQLSQLDTKKQAQIQHNISAGINRLQSFQTLDGGFAYWPGQAQSNAWGTNYAGHFLLLARQAGYEVPESLMQQWLSYQYLQSNFAVDSSDSEKVKAQAYRLFTLSLYGKPNWSAMYRLKALQVDDSASVALLSLAYLYAGQDDVARSLISGGLTAVDQYDTNSSSFGSVLRDNALFLMLYAKLADPVSATELAESIAGQLAEDRWHSTQSTAFALVALARYQQAQQSIGGSDNGNSEVVVVQQGSQQTLEVTPQVSEVDLLSDDTATAVNVSNAGVQPVWLTLTQSGVAEPGSELEYAQGLALEVSYANSEGKTVAVDRLPQGANITAQIRLSNITQHEISNIALNFWAASGWQIDNEREVCSEAACQLDYVDIRDDRVSAYMGLKAGEAKTLSIPMNASFVGHFYLPAASAYAMYNDNLKAQVKGQSVAVIAADK